MIKLSKTAIRDAKKDNVTATLVELKKLDPRWRFVENTGTYNLYKLITDAEDPQAA